MRSRVSASLTPTSAATLDALFSSTPLGLGIWDLVQPRHAILRNFPVLGHARYEMRLHVDRQDRYEIKRAG